MEEKQKKNQIERALLVLETLFLDPINGLSNKEIIEKTKFTAVDVCRLLKTLHSSKWADKNKYNRWIPSVVFLNFSTNYFLTLSNVKREIDKRDIMSIAHAHR